MFKVFIYCHSSLLFHIISAYNMNMVCIIGLFNHNLVFGQFLQFAISLLFCFRCYIFIALLWPFHHTYIEYMFSIVGPLIVYLCDFYYLSVFPWLICYWVRENPIIMWHTHLCLYSSKLACRCADQRGSGSSPDDVITFYLYMYFILLLILL